MHIIFGQENTSALKEKYTVLTLDTFRLPGEPEPVTAYCVIEKIPLEEMTQLESWQDLHENLVAEYKIKNWKYCEDALEHLRGRWQGELDTFYQDLSTRISQYKVHDPGSGWNGVIDKT